MTEDQKAILALTAEIERLRAELATLQALYDAGAELYDREIDRLEASNVALRELMIGRSATYQPAPDRAV